MMNGFEGHGFQMGYGWIAAIIVVVIFAWLIIKAVNRNNRPDS